MDLQGPARSPYKTLLGCQCCLGRLYQASKGVAITNRQIGQDLAVDIYTCLMKAIDEAIVGEAVHADSGVDAGYPEAAKLPFAVPAMHIGVMEAVDEGLAGPFEKAMANTPMTPRLGDHPLMPSSLGNASLDPAQILTPLDSQLKATRPRREEGDVRAGESSGVLAAWCRTRPSRPVASCDGRC